MSFEIELPLFKGPFDLLLFFIERDELDINDIPISEITNNFLDYLKHLEELNIEVASDFILVASTLMSIKAKMLVPRPDLDEEGNELDPREELVTRLLEYKKYKSVLDDLKSLEHERASKEKRGNVVAELKKLSETNNVESEMQDLDLYKLMKVYQKVLKRYEVEKNKPIHEVVQYPYTVSETKSNILRLVETKSKVSFIDLIDTLPEKIAIIFNFLSILELLQLNLIKISIGEGYNNFWLQEWNEDE